MSNRMTSIDLPGVRGSGIAEWGRKTPAEMITLLRQHAESQRAAAESIIAACDKDFYVQTYVGIYMQRQREVLQKGRKP